MASLSNKFDEISGLAHYNDSILIAIVDGGGKASLYFLNLKGEQIHECALQNAKNVDWEDLCIDNAGNIYIGDFGNNLNQRKDLIIYSVNAKLAYQNKTCDAKIIRFSYPEQTKFPPDKNELYFDCESLFCDKNNLYLLTKCRSEPFDGKTYLYSLDKVKSDQKAKLLQVLDVGSDSWLKSSFTGACLNENELLVLSYSFIFLYEFRNNKMKFVKKEKFGSLTQKESISFYNGKIIIADEKFPILGGGNLYTFEWKKN